MRQWKLIYLVLALALFVVLMIPIFQNMVYPTYVMFFKQTNFMSMYMTLVPLSMLDWALVALYIRSLITDVSRQWATKFDLKD